VLVVRSIMEYAANHIGNYKPFRDRQPLKTTEESLEARELATRSLFRNGYPGIMLGSTRF